MKIFDLVGWKWALGLCVCVCVPASSIGDYYDKGNLENIDLGQFQKN